MKKNAILIPLIIFVVVSCGSGKSTKKRHLDDSLFKYASLIRWSNYNDALAYLKPETKEIIPSKFELDHLKQFKVSRYTESPIRPGNKENLILQDVEIQLYNIHTSKLKTIYDHQI